MRNEPLKPFEKEDAPRLTAGQKTQKMISEFSNLQTIKWVAVAFVVHAIVICSLSVRNIRDYMDPAGAAVRAAADEAATRGQAEARAPAPAQPSAAPPAAAKSTASGAPASQPDDNKLLQEHKNTPEGKAITDTAKPSELPKEPDGGLFDDVPTSRPAK